MKFRQGIALGGGRLADDFIMRGALVRPIAATMRSESAAPWTRGPIF